ncbi:MAG: hypothetical protein ACR2J4_00185 [Deinococcus sp.]
MLDTLNALTVPYLLLLLALALEWLWRVWREGRQHARPGLARLAPPGLTALLAAPLTHTDALFGVGAALLLIAAYAPAAYLPRPALSGQQARDAAGRSLVGLLGLFVCAPLLLALGTPGKGWSAGWTGSLAGTGWLAGAWAVWAGVTLWALGQALGLASGRRASARAASRGPGLGLRFGPLASPEWPDLELRLEPGRARLLNVGSSALYLAGWSPASVNAWLLPRDEGGRPLGRLPVGKAALLTPWPQGEAGLRVWYRRDGSPGGGMVFRADWTPPGSLARVLN